MFYQTVKILPLMALAAAASAAGFDDFLAPGAAGRLVLDLKPAASQAPSLPARPACGTVQRVPLGGANDYWRTDLSFQLQDGRWAHIAGNKDRSQGDHDGYFMSFLIDGQSQPVWVAPDKQPVRFTLAGSPYSVVVLVGGIGIFHPLNDMKLLRHPESLRIRITQPDDPSFSFEFMAGQLVNAMRQTGQRLELGGRVYYASYEQDIKEVKGRAEAPVELLPKYTLFLLPEMQAKKDSKGNSNYQFGWDDRIEMPAERLEAGPYRPMRKGDSGEEPLPFAFQLERQQDGQSLLAFDQSGCPVNP